MLKQIFERASEYGTNKLLGKCLSRYLSEHQNIVPINC
jgi:hypothetical protein